MKGSSIINIENKWLIRILFAVLFIYLILRGIFVEPLLDELGTLHWYIQTGNIINENAVLDANNHLFNSYFSHYAFRLFGDHLVVYRLLALLSFPIYFFSAKKLVAENIKQFPLIVFLALISLHWVFDYFSLSRGYAPSVAFLMLAMSLIPSWNKQGKPFYLAIILVSFTLCLGSNLSMFVPVLLLFAYLHLTLLIQWKQRTLGSKITSYIISAGFLYVTYKLFKYVLKLKEAGALWWGSKKGLWEVTGKSVSENVFFTSAESIKLGIIILFATLFAILIVSFLKKGLKELVLSIQFWAFGLLLLSLLSTVLLVKVMNVNYPEDRVAMYLILLLIISMGALFSELRNLKWTLLVLLWFPISFIAKINLNTTIFSPKDRIHNSFYFGIQKVVGPNDALTADYVAHLCYSYASRENSKPKMAVLNDSKILNGEDYHLASYYSKIKKWKNYECILSDSITGMKLYKRVSKTHETKLLNNTVKHIKSTETYIPLLEHSLKELPENIKLKVIIEGSISLPVGLLTLDLIEDVINDEHQSSDYSSTILHWYFGLNKHYSFNYSRIITATELQGKTLKIYMFNPDLGEVELNNFNIKILGLKK